MFGIAKSEMRSVLHLKLNNFRVAFLNENEQPRINAIFMRQMYAIVVVSYHFGGGVSDFNCCVVVVSCNFKIRKGSKCGPKMDCHACFPQCNQNIVRQLGWTGSEYFSQCICCHVIPGGHDNAGGQCWHHLQCADIPFCPHRFSQPNISFCPMVSHNQTCFLFPMVFHNRLYIPVPKQKTTFPRVIKRRYFDGMFP